MFRGQDVQEKVSVIGTTLFMDFVEGIRNEGVELETRPMGDRTPGTGPMVIEVDRDNPEKDIEALDIELPVLTRRIEREYKKIWISYNPAGMNNSKLTVKQFSAAEPNATSFSNTLMGTKSAMSPK